MSSRRAAPRRLTSLVALALLLAAPACIRGSLPAREFYRMPLPDTLLPPRVNEPAAREAPLEGTLAVHAYRAPGLYGQNGIVFRIEGTEYGSYPTRDWAIPLGDQLGLMTEAVLRRNPLTREGALFEPPNQRNHTYLWRGTIREFEEVNVGKAVSTAVRLEAVLLRARDDSVLWSGIVRLERPVAEPTMEHIVESLSALTVEAIGRLVEEARAQVSQPSRAVAPRP